MFSVASCMCSPPCHLNEEVAKRQKMHWLAGHDIHLAYTEHSKEMQKYSRTHLVTGENCHNSHWASPQLAERNELPKIFSEEREEVEGL